LAIQVRATLVCDDFRVEKDGKLILIGIYAGVVVVQSVPAQLPAGGLTLFEIFETDQAGSYPIDIRIRHVVRGRRVRRRRSNHPHPTTATYALQSTRWPRPLELA